MVGEAVNEWVRAAESETDGMPDADCDDASVNDIEPLLEGVGVCIPEPEGVADADVEAVLLTVHVTETLGDVESD